MKLSMSRPGAERWSPVAAQHLEAEALPHPEALPQPTGWFSRGRVCRGGVLWWGLGALWKGGSQRECSALVRSFGCQLKPVCVCPEPVMELSEAELALCAQAADDVLLVESQSEDGDPGSGAELADLAETGSECSCASSSRASASSGIWVDPLVAPEVDPDAGSGAELEEGGGGGLTPTTASGCPA